MKTFQEFMLLVEKYYAPTDKLPSGQTPRSKAFNRQSRPFSSEYKKNKHWEKTKDNVFHGADNPNLKTHSHPHLKINHGTTMVTFHHRPTGVEFNIYKLNDENSVDGKPTHGISWRHSDNNSTMSDREKQHMIRNAKYVWKRHVEPRLPSHSVVMNSPSSNDHTYKDSKGNTRIIEKNARGKLYQRMGFGKIDRDGDQYAKVGRPSSSKQAAKGKGRLTPIDRD